MQTRTLSINEISLAGREWCFISEQVATQGNNWGYCAPALDYGKARISAQMALEEKVSELSDEISVMLELSAEALALDDKLRSSCNH